MDRIAPDSCDPANGIARSSLLGFQRDWGPWIARLGSPAGSFGSRAAVRGPGRRPNRDLFWAC
eukprot:9649577-Alexandrium_andersonii.AAC.1